MTPDPIDGPGVAIHLVRIFPVAWVVQGDDDVGAEIVWAATEAEAIAIAEGEYGTSDVGRAAWADPFEAERVVPLEAFFDAGYQLSCYECGEELDPDAPPVFDGPTRVFCCQECLAAYEGERRRTTAAMDAAVNYVKARWLAATVSSAWMGRDGGCDPKRHPENLFVANVRFRCDGMQDFASFCSHCARVLTTAHDANFLLPKFDQRPRMP